MTKIRVWDLSNLFHHPFSHGDVDQKDRWINLLSRKFCPLHLTPLVLYNVFKSDDYIREQYGCVSCRCTADFVGDEMKSGSVGPTLDFIELFNKDVKKFTAVKNNPTDEDGGVEI